MNDHTTHRTVATDAAKPKREFVKPELRREAQLPKITNAFIGSYDAGTPQ
jgi:hypothetical protein